LARRAISLALAAEGMAWTAGAFSDSSIMSMPCASICRSRCSWMSSRRALNSRQ
jgi:hypothetical protein